MNSLHQFKQKGRILRNLLAQAFQTDVKLSQAYELIAGMEGAADWNTFSAQLAGKSAATPVVTPAQAAPTEPTIKAVIQTRENDAHVEFDAVAWFEQASEDDIAKLLTEDRLGLGRHYSGEQCLKVAQFFVGKEQGVSMIYDFVNQDSRPRGELRCSIAVADVARWLKGRGNTAQALRAVRAVFRTVDGVVRAEFDASPWLAQASADDIKILMEEKPRMAPVGFELSYGGMNGMSDAAAEFCAKTNVEVKAVYDYIQALDAAGQDCGGSDCYIDAYDVAAWLNERKNANKAVAQAPVEQSGSIRLILDTQLDAPENEELVLNMCRSIWSGRLDVWMNMSQDQCSFIIDDDHTLTDALSEYNVTATGEDWYSDEALQSLRDGLDKFGYSQVANELREGKRLLKDVLDHDFSELQPLTPAASKLRLVEPAAVTAEGLFSVLKVIEVNLVDVLNEYDVPDDTPEWQWVEAHHSFKHKGNGGDPGVWEFMVNVESHKDAKDIPTYIKPFFDEAVQQKAAWILFHQG